MGTWLRSAAVLVMLAWCAGCAANQAIPLTTDRATRELLVGQWEGTYEWPSNPLKSTKRVTLSVPTVTAAGEVRAAIQLFDASNTSSLRRQLKGSIKDGKLVFDYSPSTDVFRDFVLSRVGPDRLLGSCEIATKGGMGATRMDAIEMTLTRVGSMPR